MQVWLQNFFSSLDFSSWAIIAVIAYMVLTKKIDVQALWDWIRRPTPPVPPGPTPPPGPVPGPTPTPVFDIGAILQLLLNVLLKAKNTNDKPLEDATTKVIEHLQAEQAVIQKSSLAVMSQPHSS